MIGSLVRAGANCNQADRSGVTPLWVGSFNGHLGSVKALLESGADINKARTDTGTTPLYIACQNGHVSIVEALLGRGADVNQARTDDGSTPASIASQKGHTLILKSLLDARADISKLLTSGPNKGASALWAAAFSGRSECLDQLLAASCDVNARTDDGRSPLDIATAKGHAHMAQQLVLAGATPSVAAGACSSSS